MILAESRILPYGTFRTYDLSRFCDSVPRVGSYDLTQPFVQGRYEYATDRAICVRVRQDTLGGHSCKRPKMSFLWDEKHDDNWAPWPERNRVAGLMDGTCPTCDGRGRLGADVRVCGRCCGEGYVTEIELSRSIANERRCTCVSGYIGGSACNECEGREKNR